MGGVGTDFNDMSMTIQWFSSRKCFWKISPLKCAPFFLPQSVNRTSSQYHLVERIFMRSINRALRVKCHSCISLTLVVWPPVSYSSRRLPFKPQCCINNAYNHISSFSYQTVFTLTSRVSTIQRQLPGKSHLRLINESSPRSKGFFIVKETPWVL